MTITVSTDGSALGNPNGPMGWAWADHTSNAAHTSGHEHAGDCDAGGATNGTNQIGELCAVLEALRAHPGPEPLIIETDSQYAINCVTKWVHGWKRNGWKNAQKKPVKNAALIKAIDAELTHRPGSVKFVWVKGHAGNTGNEKVDELARTYAGDCRSGVREGYLPLEGWQSLLASEYAKGTDVPEDARMLMDGRISADEYHLGRGEETGGTARRPVGESSSGESTSSSRKPSLVELLTEPEGVPQLYEDTAQDASPIAVTDAMHGNAHADDARDTAADSESAAQRQSPAQQLEQGSATPQLKPTSLTVSGALRFTPPPSSSPTYDGRPRAIHGLVAVDGYVNGDGTMTIDNATFYMR